MIDDAYFSTTKLWSITSGVCGSIIPILALADTNTIKFRQALFMATTGTSFSIFVGPWLAQKVEITSTEGLVALSWCMGAIGIFLIRSVLKWLDQKGVLVIDSAVNKFIGTTTTTTATNSTTTTVDTPSGGNQ